MNKKFKVLIPSFALLLASCDLSTIFNSSKSHTFASEWSHNETSHWHACTDEGCNEKSDEAKHNWGEGVVTKEATCSEKGTKTYTCECGATKTEDIDMIAHTYGEWQKYNATHHKKVCECGDIITEAHSWNQGTVTTDPTCTTKGVKTFECTVCGETRTEEVDMIAHDLTHHEAVAATYENDGNIEYYTCSECSGFFVKNGEEYEEIQEQDIVVSKIAALATFAGASIYQSTEGWNGSTKGGAQIYTLTYATKANHHLAAYFWYSAGAPKETNFLNGISEGDEVLEVVSRHSATVNYCDGAKLYYATPLELGDNDEALLKVNMYAQCNTHGGYNFFIADSEGKTYSWRIENTDYTGYAWNELSLSVKILKDAGLKDIKFIDLVAVGSSKDTKIDATYAAYKFVGIEVPEEKTMWGGAEVLPNTEGFPGSTKGGATINVLDYADRESKNLLGQFPYSGASSEKGPNFLAGLNEGDQVLEVVSRCSTSVNYCDGAKLVYDTPLAFGENTSLEVVVYLTTVAHGGYCFYIKDDAGHNYEWRIENNTYTAYSWQTFKVDVSTLTGAGLTNIKTIDLVAVGTTLDTKLTCTYAGYKSVQLKKEAEAPAEVSLWPSAATIGQNTEGWEGKTVGGANIHTLSYEERNSTNLLGDYPYSGSNNAKSVNFLAGLEEGDSVLEVTSRIIKTGADYNDGAKLTFETPIELTGHSTLEVKVYVTYKAPTSGGYSYYIKDSAGNMYTWRIQYTEISAAYSWNTFTLDVAELSSLSNIKSIDLVNVDSTLDTNITRTYAGYKSIVLK